MSSSKLSYRPTHLAILLLIVVALCRSVTAGPAICWRGKTFCYQANVVGNNVTMQFSFTTAGWVAVGIGSSMSDADIMMAWVNTQNRPTISDRRSTFQDTPPEDTRNSLSLVNFTLGDGSSKPHIITLTRLVDTKDTDDKVFTNSNMSMIYAYSSTPILSANRIAVHDDKGSFRYNVFDLVPFGSTPVQYETGLSYSSVVITHGVFMFLAWGVLTPLSIFIARFLKGYFGASWFTLHRGLFFLVAVLNIAGLIIIVLGVKIHFANFHAILGLIIIIFMIGQIIIGFVIDHLFDSNRTSVPLCDKAHWWVGRLLACAAPINIFLGILKYNQSIKIVIPIYLVTCLVTIAVYVVGQMKFGQTFDGPKPPRASSVSATDIQVSNPSGVVSSNLAINTNRPNTSQIHLVRNQYDSHIHGKRL